MFTKPNSALILIGHGSTQNPDSSAPTLNHARTIRQRAIFKEVTCAFWKEEPSLRQVLHTVDSDDVYIVPNFISEGYFTRTIIPRELGLHGPLTHLRGKTLKYCAPVGNHPRVTQIILKRAAEVAPKVPFCKTSLLIVGHGTNLSDNSAAAARREAERIAQMGIYAEVSSAYMEEAPFIAEWNHLTTQPNVVVVPFFISDGLHSYQDIPMLLGFESESGSAASSRDVFRHNPHLMHNRSLYYASSIGTEPDFAELILDQVASFDTDHPELSAPGSLPK